MFLAIFFYIVLSQKSPNLNWKCLGLQIFLIVGKIPAVLPPLICICQIWFEFIVWRVYRISIWSMCHIETITASCIATWNSASCEYLEYFTSKIRIFMGNGAPLEFINLSILSFFGAFNKCCSIFRILKEYFWSIFRIFLLKNNSVCCFSVLKYQLSKFCRRLLFFTVPNNPE